MIPRNYSIPFVAILAFLLSKPMADGWEQTVLLFLLICVFVQIITFFLLPARRVEG